MIASIAWQNKKKNQASTIKMRNGWEIRFYSSEGKPPQGAALHLCWFDEEILDPDWLPEMRARLLDFDGVLLWSATPQAGTEQLYGLYERGQEEVNEPNPSVVTFELLLANNAYMHEQQKLDFARDIDDDEQRQVRIDGKFILTSYRVFPEWRGKHQIDSFQVPQNWTRYLFVDPGRQFAAALFLAVPPPNESPHVYFYDEVYCRDADARKFADMVAAKVGQDRIECQWIDMARGEQERDAGTGSQLYRRLRQVRSVKRRNRAHRTDGYAGFRQGARRPGWRPRGYARAGSRTDEDGITKPESISRPLPESRQRDEGVPLQAGRREDGGWVVTDEPVKKRDHLVDCLRYAASIDPGVRPAAASGSRGPEQ
jgi:hypothetical protein